MPTHRDDSTETASCSPTRYVMRKLPHVTALFWAMKIVATTLGETGGDLMAQTLNVGYLASTFIFLGCFLVAVAVQLKARSFHPAIFWTVIVCTSTAGTTLSDFMNRTGGLGYTGGALVLSALLAIVFIVWWRSGQTLDVENIATVRGETLYWIAIVCSNSLGTSSGDFLADTLNVGFLGSTLVLSAIMLSLLAGHYFSRVSGVLIFWLAFILTRPLGAVVGNLFSKPADRGGLDWGAAVTSAGLLAILVALVIYQIVLVRRHPLDPVPAPRHRRTGVPLAPSGAVVGPGL
jgi:uncharacterized membrane-anchored protein